MSKTPGSEPAPTRPNWKWLVGLVVAIIAVEAATHWSEVAAFTHLAQIEHSLGMD